MFVRKGAHLDYKRNYKDFFLRRRSDKFSETAINDKKVEGIYIKSVDYTNRVTREIKLEHTLK